MPPVLSLKFSYNGEIHRFSFETLQVPRKTIKAIHEAVYGSFHPELDGKVFLLRYTDEDQDVITVSTDAEVKEAFAVAEHQNRRALHFEVVLVASKEKDNKSVHFRIICDECGMSPIIGTRYKCSVRDDYDLCEACERADESPHPFLKIKSPAHAPAAIMTILKGQSGSAEAAAGRTPPGFTEVIEQVMPGLTENTEQIEQQNSAPKAARHMAGVPVPSLVRLECAASVRDFGPFVAHRKPNGTLVLKHPEAAGSRRPDKPWKGGGCLRIGRKSVIDMEGNGGPWASFHVETVGDSVRLVCANRKFCLAAQNGRLAGVPNDPSHKGDHTLFRLRAMKNNGPSGGGGESGGGGSGRCHFRFGGGGGGGVWGGGNTSCRAAVHPGITCDKSGMSPIVGPRFHVLGNDYDVCQAEFDKLPEAERVLYVKIDKPGAPPVPCTATTAGGFEEERPPACAVEVEEAEIVSLPWREEPAAAAAFEAPLPKANPVGAGAAAEEEGEELLLPPPAVGCFAAAAAIAKPSPEVPKKAAAFLGFGPPPQASFVADVTVPDGLVVKPSQPLLKVWRLRNDGDAPFPAGTTLVRVGGHPLGGPVRSEPVCGMNTAAAAVRPLEEFEVAVKLVAPPAPGHYHSYWRLETREGMQFGHRLWVDLIVAADAAPSEAAPSEAGADEAGSDEAAVERAQEEAKAAAAAALAVAEAAAAKEASEIAAAEAAAAAAAAEADAKAASVVAEAEAEATAALVEAKAQAEAMAESQNAAEAEGEAAAAADEEERSKSPSIDWEHVPQGGVGLIDDLIDNLQDQAALGSGGGSNHGGSSSEASFSDHLSVSFEGAAAAGAALAESGMLSASVVAVVEEIKTGKWEAAVARLTEMGFQNVPGIVAACEKHATPDTFEAKLQEIVDEMLSDMPAL